MMDKKLPTIETLTELAKSHTFVDIARIYGVTKQSVHNKLKPLGIIPITRQQQKIIQAGGLNVLYQEACEIGLTAVSDKYHIEYKTLKDILPPIPHGLKGKSSNGLILSYRKKVEGKYMSTLTCLVCTRITDDQAELLDTIAIRLGKYKNGEPNRSIPLRYILEQLQAGNTLSLEGDQLKIDKLSQTDT
jgi:hypothetical protein